MKQVRHILQINNFNSEKIIYKRTILINKNDYGASNTITRNAISPRLKDLTTN
jgi:hypothetical protein